MATAARRRANAVTVGTWLLTTGTVTAGTPIAAASYRDTPPPTTATVALASSPARPRGEPIQRTRSVDWRTAEVTNPPAMRISARGTAAAIVSPIICARLA